MAQALQRWLVRCSATARAGWATAAQAPATTTARVVLGNESADLDSVVASVAYGYFATSGDADCVPVINIKRRDFRLRTEVTYLFGRLGLSWDALVFVDEVDLDSLAQQGRLALTLVDHNRLCLRQTALAPAVAAILDHHADDGQYPTASPRLVETVGSATTLVVDTVVRPRLGDVNATVAQLLLAPILVDTVNLDPVHKRTTPKDLAAVHTLERLAWPEIDSGDTDAYQKARTAFFQALFEAKLDTASLTVDDLLRKDYKQWSLPGSGEATAYGIAAVPETLADFCKRPFAADLEAFCIENGRLAFLLCMTFHDKPTFQRGLVIFTPSYTSINHDVLKILQNPANDVGLIEQPQLLAGENQHDRIRAFEQTNITISRKKLQPILEEGLKKL